MTKRLWVWILTGLAALVAVIVILLLPRSNELQTGKAKIEKLPPGEAIMVDARAERFGVQKGDAFLYFVDILYSPEQITEIDKDSLDENIKLEPFEIRSMQESDFKLDSNTRVYRRQYEIQLIDGEVDHLYEFPSIVVRYHLKDSVGFQEVPSTAEPVYVTSRLPEDIDELVINVELGYGLLRPLEGEVESTGQSRLPWVFVAAGALLAVGSLADFGLRVAPKRRAERERERSEQYRVISQNYISLHQNIAKGAPAGDVLYQIDHILRFVLAQKMKADWLEEMDINLIPAEIRGAVTSLLDNNQKAEREGPEQKHVEESLGYLDKILRFYYAEEVDSWKS